ncbi:MAG: hypothetical protein AVDCRST_MAG86-2197 [uncultured Truepera sp.]|uniref:Uncharacterized protein n=1 Tax=uncultured Truepera sp. TaxID=543023 RepID=A0A6J4VEF2_9DEIN|nr:MAG: hypothetical protein AVDCRST_MAG86-2197 [uncultured Truepera sp.]
MASALCIVLIPAKFLFQDRLIPGVARERRELRQVRV